MSNLDNKIKSLKSIFGLTSSLKNYKKENFKQKKQKICRKPYCLKR